MPRNTQVLIKGSIANLDDQIARLKADRDRLAAEYTVDIDVILAELKNVTLFNYQWSAIWFAVTPTMQATLPAFIGGQEEFVVPLEDGVSMCVSQGNHISLIHLSKDPNKILPFLKRHGVRRDQIDYSHKIRWRDEAAKKLSEEQKAVDEIVLTIEETYAT